MQSAAPIMRSPSAAPPLAVVPQDLRFAFRGNGTELFLLVLKNVLLTLVTLGVYAAWAKVEKRKFLWRNTEVGGHRLDYTGTGWELFKGYLIVIGGYLGFVAVVAIANKINRGLGIAVQLVMALVILGLIPYAIYRSRAYLLSRTRWRGVRFGMADNVAEFAGVFIGGYFATLFSLGIYAPFWINNMTRVLTNNTRFGSQRFGYDGVGSELFWIYFKGILLSIVTLGIYSFWLQAEITRYTMSHTTFMSARGRSELTGGTVLGLTLLSLVGTTLTLGIAFPWIAVHSLEVVLSKIRFEGEVDFAAIAASSSEAGAAGDAMADALDVGLGV